MLPVYAIMWYFLLIQRNSSSVTVCLSSYKSTSGVFQRMMECSCDDNDVVSFLWSTDSYVLVFLIKREQSSGKSSKEQQCDWVGHSCISSGWWGSDSCVLCVWCLCSLRHYLQQRHLQWDWTCLPELCYLLVLVNSTERVSDGWVMTELHYCHWGN